MGQLEQCRNRQVVKALEPKPTTPKDDPHRPLSTGGLHHRNLFDGDPNEWHPVELLRGDDIAVAEAILCQDPERREAYGRGLIEAVFGYVGRHAEFLEGEQLADIATATPEQRLRAMYAATCGGKQ